MELVVDEARSARRKRSPILRTALGIRHVGGLIVAFQERYPGIAVDLSLTDERIDLVREGVDVALRLGPLADSSMKPRAPGTSGRVLVGSPDYLVWHERPTKPGEFAALEGVRCRGPGVVRQSRARYASGITNTSLARA